MLAGVLQCLLRRQPCVFKGRGLAGGQPGGVQAVDKGVPDPGFAAVITADLGLDIDNVGAVPFSKAPDLRVGAGSVPGVSGIHAAIMQQRERRCYPPGGGVVGGGRGG